MLQFKAMEASINVDSFFTDMKQTINEVAKLAGKVLNMDQVGQQPNGLLPPSTCISICCC